MHGTPNGARKDYNGRMRRISRLHLTGLAICLGALAFGYLYLEQTLGLEPCPLCVLDRIVLLALAAIFALAHFQRPSAGERIGYDIGALIVSLGGIGIAARHVQLQSRPPDSLSDCGAGFWHMLDQIGIEGAVADALRGGGDCGSVQWTFLGLSIPTLTLGVFVVLSLLSLTDLIDAIRNRHRES